MAKVLFVSENDKKSKKIEEILQKNSHDFLQTKTQVETIDSIKHLSLDIVILDLESKSLDMAIISKKIKSFENILTISLTKSDDIDPEILKNTNAFLTEPISKNLLISTINSNIRTKNYLEKLSSSNQELARSLYQLNVLYDTSSQFAGTLDKKKLIDIMIEGIEKSLNFELSCTLTFENENEPILIINSLHQIPDRLLEALKLRTTLNYKSLFDKKENSYELNLENIKIEKHIKHPLKEYDFSILRADSMFAPIVMSESFFGFVEIYRNSEFTTEDATCFQTLAQQVSLPLKSANLYEIKEQTNKKLERLERLKSEFISIVSHELRTPLTAIKNALDIILSGKTGNLTEHMDKFLNMAKRNAHRLSGIINDLLDLSKIEAGKMDFKFEKTILEPVIEYVKTSLEGMAKEKGINLEIRDEASTTKIYADARRLEQVLTNLVSNAIKFTGNGGKIEVHTQVLNAKDIQCLDSFEPELNKLNGDYVVVRVKDNGIGIEKGNLAHVFDKFAQIENSLSREVGGSGLGLPIARQLLEAHNGTIWCNSMPEKGSSFYFAVPVTSEFNDFMINLKQLIQKSKISNSSVAIMKISGENNVIQDILDDKNLINKKYLNNSLIQEDNNTKTLSLVIDDGDRFLVEFIKKKIEEFMKLRGNLYPHYAIMFSSALYPEDGLEEEELLYKLGKSEQKLRNIQN